jgi:hypothetical protein
MRDGSQLSSPNQIIADTLNSPIQRQVAPGKVAKTNHTPIAPVQRKPVNGSGPEVIQRRPADNWAANPLTDAALRGSPVQMKGDAPQPAAQPAAPTDQRMPTREEVYANPQQYGVPEGGNPEDWFNEYVAHTLAYMNPEQLDLNALDPNDPEYAQKRATIMRHRETMEGWGYNPDSLTFLSDSQRGDNETGLQAVRIDPTDPKGEHGSIVGFRGTEPFAGNQSTLTNPLGALDDAATDFGRDIGSTQFDPNQERIRELIQGGTGPITLTGHSLGGALAQHAAANNTDLLGEGSNVVGFQAPGIDSASANQFEAANADDHIGVRFHEHENDIVHRAGQQKLGGTHNTYHDTNDPGVVGAHTGYFMYDGVNGGGDQVAHVGEGSTSQATEHDPVTNRLGWEGGRKLVGGLGNIAASPFQGAFALGSGLVNAGANAGTGLYNSGADLVGGVAQGGSTVGTGLSQGASEVWNGDILSGLGTMAGGTGRGLGQMAGGVWEGTKGVVGTAAGLVGDTAGAVANGVGTLGSQLADGVGTGARAVGDLAKWGWNSVTGLFR